jgi:hypothetical protein
MFVVDGDDDAAPEEPTAAVHSDAERIAVPGLMSRP